MAGHPFVFRLFHTLFSFLVFYSPECAAECPSTISIPIINVTLANGAVSRGLSVTLGDPEQSIAMMPEWAMNNTYIFDTNSQCGAQKSEAFCITYRGGLYNESASKNYTLASRVSESGADPFDTGTDVAGDIWCTDTLGLTDNISLSEYPLGILRADLSAQYHSQHVLGLGSNSTVLSALKSAGRIASRSWSMFWGLTGATPPAQMDGSFVLGGFDSAKVTGESYTAALENNTNCGTGMVVTISDLQLNFPNGSTSSIFDGIQSAAMSACIAPDFPVLMTLPYKPYYERFESIIGKESAGRSNGINFWGMLYDFTDVYDGDLTIQFSTGLSVRVPNSQLVLPDITIDATTGALTSNSSVREVIINSLQDINSADLPLLGRQFLSAAYVFLNQDAGTFTLWAANPTTEQSLVAVDERGTQIDPTTCSEQSSNMTIVSNTTNALTIESNSPTTPAGSASTATAQSKSKHRPGSFSVGIIAGAAIGGVAALCAIVMLAALAFRRRRASTITSDKAAAAAAAAAAEALWALDAEPPTPPYATHPRAYVMQEMDVDGQVVSELAGKGNDSPRTVVLGAKRDTRGGAVRGLGTAKSVDESIHELGVP